MKLTQSYSGTYTTDNPGRNTTDNQITYCNQCCNPFILQCKSYNNNKTFLYQPACQIPAIYLHLAKTHLMLSAFAIPSMESIRLKISFKNGTTPNTKKHLLER